MAAWRQVRWWDMTAEKQVSMLRGHTDYVRAACLSPADSSCWATGELKLCRSAFQRLRLGRQCLQAICG